MIQFERVGIVLRPMNNDQSKFNAGMIDAGDGIHMLYRFCEKRERWHNKPIDWSDLRGVFPYGRDYICSALINSDGTLREDFGEDRPVLYPESPEIVGCEDPRIVLFEGRFYIFYCVFDMKKARVAIAETSDFKQFRRLGTVEHFASDKDAFIFPERIGGKVAYMHRIEPNIQIDYFDSIASILAPKSWAGYERKAAAQAVLKPRAGFEAVKVGGGVPPIKTPAGWLLLYHAVDAGHLYHIGAALLALDHPSRVLARLPYPVLSPEAEYELSGDYHGCVFAQGYYIHDGYVYISYGTADKYTAIARADLSQLLNELERNKCEG